MQDVAAAESFLLWLQPPPHAPATAPPTAETIPARPSASTDIVASTIPSFADRRDAWLVRSAQTATTKAATVDSAQPATMESARGPQ